MTFQHEERKTVLYYRKLITMDRNDNYDRNSRNQRPRRRKVCQFCIERTPIDYKDVGRLRKMITERAKIVPRRVTGTCSAHQRELTTAIKRARYLALLPYLID